MTIAGAADPLLGTEVGRYRIVRPLAAGDSGGFADHCKPVGEGAGR